MVDYFRFARDPGEIFQKRVAKAPQNPTLGSGEFSLVGLACLTGLKTDSVQRG